ncbi:MAG: 30S ribosomal protein S8 [Candidatus Carsonella ruddii]
MKNYYDSVNRIYNSYISGKKISYCNFSKFTMLILEILLQNNFIKNYFLIIINNKKFIIIFIKNIIYLKFISKPSKKISLKHKKLNNVYFNSSLSIVNTNLGLLTVKETKKIGIGGFIILIIL